MNTAAVGPPAWPTRPGLLLAIDCRRPASWLAFCAAAATTLAVCLVPLRAPEQVAFVAGGLLAVAATGGLPGGAADGIRTLWLTERAAWPLVGVMVACGALLPWRPAALGPAAAAVGGGVLAGAVVILAMARRAMHAADAASLAVAVVCAAALLAGGIIHWSGPGDVSAAATGMRMLATVGVLWLVLACVAGMAAECMGPGNACSTALPTAAPVHAPLLWLAMVTSLAGMVSFFFLAPEQAGWYPLVVLAWFASLAMPQATLLMGDEHAAGWERLMRSINGSGATVTSRRTGATIGGLLGWPAAVAVAVRTAVPDDSEQVVSAAVVSLVGLVGAVGVVGLAGLVAGRSRVARETAQAVACVSFIAALLGAAGLPGLPGLPGTGF